MTLTVLRDALYYTHEKSGASIEMGHGVLVGIVSAYMSIGWTFDRAWRTTIENLPTNYRPECIPESWRNIPKENS